MKTILELEFSITGMLRFISHLELQHFFARLALRVGLPVQFTQGFNPRPRISLPVPRTVGIASLDDRARVELEADIEPKSARERLGAVAPPGLEIRRAWRTAPGRLERVTALEWRIDTTGADSARVAERVAGLLAGPVPMPRRVKKTRAEYTVDLRPLILDLAATEGEVRAKIGYSPQGSIRPGELLEMLHLPKPEFLGRMTRVRTYWS